MHRSSLHWDPGRPNVLPEAVRNRIYKRVAYTEGYLTIKIRDNTYGKITDMSIGLFKRPASMTSENESPPRGDKYVQVLLIRFDRDWKHESAIRTIFDRIVIGDFEG